MDRENRKCELKRMYKNVADENLEIMLKEALDMVEVIQDEKKSRVESKREKLWDNLIRAVKAYTEIDIIKVFYDDDYPKGSMTEDNFDKTPGFINL